MTLHSETSGPISVARYLVSRIEEMGVAVVPILQGGAAMKLIDEVGQSSRIRYISPGHEQTLAMMVDGYARVHGFGVGIATSGPGGTNLATGVACAYYDSTPCLFLTGQVGMHHVKGERKVRQRGFQETDIVGIMKPITKWATMLTDPADARYVFEKAVYLAKSGRPGPALIDVPHNVQRALVDPDTLRPFNPSPETGTLAAPDAVAQEVICDIRRAQRPMLFVGGGVKIAGQGDALLALAHTLQVPMVSTWTAAQLFTADDPLYLGHAGRLGSRAAADALARCDFLLALGSRFPARIVGNEKEFAKDARIVAVDVDPGELDDGLIAFHRKIPADLKEFLPALVRAAKPDGALAISAWRAEAALMKQASFLVDGTTHRDPKYVSPYTFVQTLSELLPRNAIIVSDTGLNLTWFMQAYRPKHGQELFSAWGHSPMGYSLAAALGAKLAAPQRPVFALIGDGGFQMNIQELQTVAVNKISVKVFILNNGCYGNTKFPAREEFEGRAYGNEPGFGYAAPDFAPIIRAYGFPVAIIDGAPHLRERIEEALHTEGPMFVDAKIHPEQSIIDLRASARS